MKRILKKIYEKLTSRPKAYGWFGNYTTWEEARKQCTGYDDLAIVEKVKSSVLKVKNGEAAYERDSVLFDEIQYSRPLLDAFQQVAAGSSGVLHVIDFGGSL